MRKRLLALLMALVMVFGLNTAYLADTDSPTKDNTEEVQKIELTWEKTDSGKNAWKLRVNRNENAGGAYRVKLYNDKKEVVSEQWTFFTTSPIAPLKDYTLLNFSDTIEKNGAGKYYAVAEVTTPGGKLIASGESEVAEYKAPATQLAITNAAVTNGVLTFDKVEGASWYSIKVTETWYSVTAGEYRESIYCTREASDDFDVSIYEEGDDYWTLINDGQTISYDFAREFEAMEVNIEENYKAHGLGTYTRTEHDFNFYVQAKSYDINEVKSSEEKKVGEYDIRFSSTQVTENLDKLVTPEALKENPNNAKNYISNLSKDTLVELVKDAAFVEKMKLVEAALIDSGKYPAPKAASTSTSVDGTKISIVGALMNVEEGTQVTLSVADAKDVTAPTGYFNAVALDIKLFAGENSLTNLNVPVQITMPIPTGVAKENLVILHYHEEGKAPQVITPVVNADGTMTFAVTGFSTFVVANTEADGTGDTDPVGVLVAVMALSAVVAVVAMKKKSVVK